MLDRLVVLFLIASMTAGCIPAAGTQSPLPPRPTTLPETAAATSTPIPSPTLKIKSTPTTQPTLTAAAEEKCLTIEDQLPAELDLKGAWVHGGYRPYLEDTVTGEKIGIPLNGGTALPIYYQGDYATSPDGRWLAYIDTYRKDARMSKRILRVISSTGYSLDMGYWPGDFQWIDGWTLNSEIILEENSLSHAEREYVVLDPFNTNYQEIRPAWLDEIEIYPYWQYLFMFLPNSKMDEVVVGTGGYNFELRDLDTGMIIDPAIASENAWSPDGGTLAEFSHSALRLISKSGGVTYISPGGKDITGIAWANSNQKLLALHSSHWDSVSPEILNITTGEFTNLCIIKDEFRYTWGDGFWSPDGRFIVLNMYRQPDQSDRYLAGEPFDLLIDTLQMRAYKLDSKGWDARIAWLAKP